jgi:predicted enzyme related to lactoylglutathione lyase
MKNPMVHFELLADDVARAKKFYEKTFDWKIEKWSGGEYWMITTTELDKNNMPKTPGAINGGLMKRQNPGQGVMDYISVDSIDMMKKMINANGGTMVMAKQEIGKDMGWTAAFKDTEGNIMGLHQMPGKMKKMKK